MTCMLDVFGCISFPSRNVPRTTARSRQAIGPRQMQGQTEVEEQDKSAADTG